MTLHESLAAATDLARDASKVCSAAAVGRHYRVDLAVFGECQKVASGMPLPRPVSTTKRWPPHSSSRAQTFDQFWASRLLACIAGKHQHRTNPGRSGRAS